MNPDPKRPVLPGRPVPRKVFDVMRPGRAPASSTSKPVIVSHKPMIQDPSVTMNGVGESRSLMDSRKKISIAAQTPAALPSPTPVPPASIHPIPKPEPPAAAQPPVPPQPAADPTPIPVAGHDTNPADDDLLAAMPPLAIDEHAGPVVSKHVGPRVFPWKWVIPIAIIVLLAVAILDIMLDADFISWDIPHTDFL